MDIEKVKLAVRECMPAIKWPDVDTLSKFQALLVCVEQLQAENAALRETVSKHGLRM